MRVGTMLRAVAPSRAFSQSALSLVPCWRKVGSSCSFRTFSWSACLKCRAFQPRPVQDQPASAGRSRHRRSRSWEKRQGLVLIS
eukprot:12928543-Prorocentrum_lima.AAC.1